MNIKIFLNPLSIYLNGEKLRRKESEGSREIFFNDKYVVKFEDTKEYPYSQCKNEYRIWKELKDSERKHFAPIIKYGKFRKYDYIVQPRFKAIRFPMYPERNPIYVKAWNEVICDLADKYNLGDLMSDLGCNWTVYKGNPLILDYGV